MQDERTPEMLSENREQSPNEPLGTVSEKRGHKTHKEKKRRVIHKTHM